MRPLLAAVLLLALSAGPASGATVTYIPGHREPPGTAPEESCSRYGQCPQASIRVLDSDGAVNRMTIEAAGGILVTDTATPPVAGTGCQQRTADSVHCPFAFVTVHAGGGSDQVTSSVPALIEGGEGDDSLAGASTMYGGAGADTLTGTPSFDTLAGGDGTDVVLGGAGNDTIGDSEQTPAADRLEGGDGSDLLEFGTRTDPITAGLTPAAQAAGGAGEHNLVSGFEALAGGPRSDQLTIELPATGSPVTGTILAGNGGDDRLTLTGGESAALSQRVVGGPGKDILTGGAGREALYGGPGADELDGGAGDDLLDSGGAGDVLLGGRGADILLAGSGDDRAYGGSGRDAFAMGSGADYVFSRDISADRVNCGTGRDRVTRDRRDALRFCERRAR